MDSDERALLLDMVERLFSEQTPPEAVTAAEEAWPASLWQHVEDAGLPLALAAAPHGDGLGLSDGAAVVASAAGHALPLPLGETMLAAAALADAELEIPTGPLALVWGDRAALQFNPATAAITGTAARVPWGRHLTGAVTLARSGSRAFLCMVDSAQLRVEPHRNLAFEPRDTLHFDAASCSAWAEVPDLRDSFALRAALLRAAQSAGALQAMLGLSVSYANERVQFGRPIARFQSVAALLAEIAMEASAAGAAVRAAVARVAESDWEAAATPVIVAKVRTAQAATVAVERAHQVHGAIGTTREHRLQLLTRRLWSWRDEYGSEAEWTLRLGRQSLATDTLTVWEFVTS